MYVSRTIPFRTAIPKSAMKPTPAEILKGIPLMSKATMPPVAANGILRYGQHHWNIFT
jgi:hypothetical protein